MRIYIIGNDGIILCREPPATVNKGEIAVASREELLAARIFEVVHRPLISVELASALARCPTISEISGSELHS